MNDIINYLASNAQIREILVLIGKESSINLLIDICRNMKLDTLKMCCFCTKTEEEMAVIHYALDKIKPENRPYNVEILERNSLKNHGLRKGFALVFDALEDTQEILSCINMEPEYLVGIMDRSKMDPFRIWENYRNVSEHIRILSWQAAFRDEVLNWDRRAENNTELSVIFPMYNVAKYLPQCVTSVTEWDAPYIEFLFVDDGSPDNCAEIIREYAKKDSRIKLLQKPNGGCASARQWGLDRAQGRYVGFIDPDDYIDPSMFRKLLARALTGSYEISYCGHKELYEETQTTMEIPDVLGYPYNYGTADPDKINELIAFRRVAIWRGIYLKEMIDRSGIHFYTDIRRFDDLPFKVETLARARSVVSVPEYLYYYRMSRPGQDVAADDERLYVHFPIFQYLDKFFENCKDERQIDYLQVVKIQTHRWALEKMKPEFVKPYCQHAKKDLLSNFSFGEGYYLIKKHCGRNDLWYFKSICWGQFWLVRILIRWYTRVKPVNKNIVNLRKLSK